MKSIEERAEVYSEKHSFRLPYDGSNKFYDDVDYKASKDGYIKGAVEQKKIDKELIDELIEELYTSRAYHLGITGLDSHEEIARKEKDGDCALIRGIDRTINYVKEVMEE